MMGPGNNQCIKDQKKSIASGVREISQYFFSRTKPDVVFLFLGHGKGNPVELPLSLDPPEMVMGRKWGWRKCVFLTLSNKGKKGWVRFPGSNPLNIFHGKVRVHNLFPLGSAVLNPG